MMPHLARGGLDASALCVRTCQTQPDTAVCGIFSYTCLDEVVYDWMARVMLDKRWTWNG